MPEHDDEAGEQLTDAQILAFMQGVDEEDPIERRRSAAKKAWAKKRPGYTPGVDDEDDYDITVCYTRSTNAHNHYERVQTRVPQGMTGRINETMERVNRHMGDQYTDAAAFTRDAIIHRLEFWNRTLPDRTAEFDTTMSMTRQEATIAKVRADIAQYDQLTRDADEMFGELHGFGSWQLMRAEWARLTDVAEELPEPWAGKLRDVLGRWEARLGG